MLKKLYYFYLKNRKPVKYLKKRGALIGSNVKIEPPIYCGEANLLAIGNDCNFSFGVTFIFHDGSNTVLEHLGKIEIGARKYGKIVIGNNVFIGAKAIIMPNVRIGNNVIIGAGSIVTKSIPDNSIAVGVPAKIIETIDDYYLKNKDQFLLVNQKKYLDKILKEPK